MVVWYIMVVIWMYFTCALFPYGEVVVVAVMMLLLVWLGFTAVTWLLLFSLLVLERERELWGIYVFSL